MKWHNSEAQYHLMFFFIKNGLNIRNTNTEAENYTRLYINVFICNIYNMGQGK
jgi:hypothetical protein